LVEVKSTGGGSAACRAASSTLKVPTRFVSKSAPGSSIEVVTATCAAR
jgi:hypothetical protein